ncbi:hypothetical protein SKAU_G00377700 [Synaphobranchus kaupii]|uniref:G-protein coupled receptors family 1 profile domain-containing protein n=1 Tax=Synaphobranchus kaupii TaxID=118154 RepID=A0A9Q1ED22_SYNKA|nr:hypothetical protein SKAU_G00377700 [Synaphobranchus kaupii]
MPAIVNLLFNTVSTNTTISFSLVLPLVSVLSLLVGVGGHLLVWLVLMKNPRRRSKPSSVLLLNLSLADLGALLTLPCVLLSASSQDWQLGGAICVLLGFMTSLTAGVDIFSLAALSVLRYRIVAPPTRQPVRPTQVAGTVAVIWLVSVTMALPKVTYIQFDGGCIWSVDQGQWLGFLVPAFLVYYVAPLLCIGINCGLIITHLHACRLSLAATRRNKKATALLIGSTLAFAISWLPYYALEFVNVLSPYVGPASSPLGPAPYAAWSNRSLASPPAPAPAPGGRVPAVGVGLAHRHPAGVPRPLLEPAPLLPAVPPRAKPAPSPAALPPASPRQPLHRATPPAPPPSISHTHGVSHTLTQ